MASPTDKLRAHVEGIRKRDGRQYDEATQFARAAPGVDPAAAGLESAAASEFRQLEAVIRMARPVLAIANDAVTGLDVQPLDPAATELAEQVRASAAVLRRAIPAIGRIELLNNDQYAWGGTGWIVASDLGNDIIVTNAHVAEIFAAREGRGFVFRAGTIDMSRHQEARIDFREEIGDSAPREFRLREVVYVSNRYPLDVALLRVERVSDSIESRGP